MVDAAVLRNVVAEVEGLCARRAILDHDIRGVFRQGAIGRDRARPAAGGATPPGGCDRKIACGSTGKIAQIEMALAAGSNRPHDGAAEHDEIPAAGTKPRRALPFPEGYREGTGCRTRSSAR